MSIKNKTPLSRAQREVMEVIDSLAVSDLQKNLLKPYRIELRRLRELSRLRQRNLVRAWFRQHGIDGIPPVRLLNAGLDSLLNGRNNSTPLLSWQSVQLRRYGEFVYLLPVM